MCLSFLWPSAHQWWLSILGFFGCEAESVIKCRYEYEKKFSILVLFRKAFLLSWMTNQCLKLYVTVRLLLLLGPIAQWLKNGRVVQLHLLNNLEVLRGKREKSTVSQRLLDLTWILGMQEEYSSYLQYLVLNLVWLVWWEYQMPPQSNILQQNKNNIFFICVCMRNYVYVCELEQ